MEWVRKSVHHRGISALPLDHLEKIRRRGDATDGGDEEEYLVQELIRPHLIGGKKWDLGLYVAVTSIRPLRAYLYNDILLRLCINNYTDPVKHPDAVLRHRRGLSSAMVGASAPRVL